MKKSLLILVFVLSLYSINAQNYGNGNGFVISSDYIPELDYKIIRWKHVQNVKMAEDCDFPDDYKSMWDDFLYLYNSDYTLVEEWGEVPLIKDCTGKTITIMEILKVIRDNDNYFYLFHVEVEGQTGYMRAFKEEADFYENGFWSIVDRIESSGKKWTIRNVRESSHFKVKERLFVRDKPGTNGTKKIYLFYKDEEAPGNNSFDGKYIKVKNVTEEKEVIDGIEGRWLNIEYENIEGWVFEGYVDCEVFWGYFEPNAIINLFFTYGQP